MSDLRGLGVVLGVVLGVSDLEVGSGVVRCQI